MGKLRVVYKDGGWEVRGGENVVKFASSMDAWTYKREHDTPHWWQRRRKAAA